MSDDQIEWTLDHLYVIFVRDLKLCICDRPETTWQLVYDLLRVYADRPAGVSVSDQVRSLIGTDGACHLALSVLSEIRLIEHAGNIWGSWLTEKGRWLLGTFDLLVMDDMQELMDRVQRGGSLPHGVADCTDGCWKGFR